MDYAYNLYGTAPLIKKYQVGASLTSRGIPVLVGGAGEEGVIAGSTTGAVDLVGITLDTATLVTAQQSDNSDPAATVSVIIQPGAVYRARLSGGATSGTALSQHTVTSASADGLTITTGTAWNSPTYDEGVAWCYSGANVGVSRKITATGATSATLTVAFPNDIAVGDIFLRAPYAASPVGMEDQFVQLTSDLTELNAAVGVDTDNNNFRVVDLHLFDSSFDGTTQSYATILPYDCVFSGGGNV